MTEQDKQLLLADLCARLPYGVKVLYEGEIKEIQYVEPLYSEVKLLEDYTNYTISIHEIKPYLRPMSSMTEEEKEYYYTFIDEFSIDNRYPQFTAKYVNKKLVDEYIDWLNRKMFDYRGLIPEGLALEAPDGMYKH